MRAHVPGITVAVVAALAASAIAQPSDGAAPLPAAGTTGARVSPKLVPVVKVDASTASKASASFGLDFLRALTRREPGGSSQHIANLRVTPAFKLSLNDGAARLVSSDSRGTTSGTTWQLGITATRERLSPLPPFGFENATVDERLAMVETCSRLCAVAADDKSCKAFKDALKAAQDEVQGRVKVATDKAEAARAQAASHAAAAKTAEETAARGGPTVADAVQRALDQRRLERELQAQAIQHDDTADALRAERDVTVATELPPASLCSAAQSRLAQLDAARRAPGLEFPTSMLSGGFAVGSTSLEYLAPQATDATMRSIVKTSKPSFSFGMALMGRDDELTVELPLRFDAGYVPSTTSARWCTPAGNVVRPMDSPAGPGSDPAEICSEKPFGEPKRTMTFQGGLYVGYLETAGSAWRAALGPTVKYDWVTKSQNTYQVGIAVPIHLSLRSVKESYKGIVRIEPSGVIVHGADGTDDARFLLSIAVLGDRQLFARALE